MTSEESNEMKRIIEKYIPLGNDYSLCHVGIYSIRRCERCKDAIKIRDLFLNVGIEANKVQKHD